MISCARAGSKYEYTAAARKRVIRSATGLHAQAQAPGLRVGMLDIGAAPRARSKGARGADVIFCPAVDPCSDGQCHGPCVLELHPSPAGETLKKLLIVAATLAALSTTAQSAAVISFTESGAGVFATLSGSLDLSGMVSGGTFGSVVGMDSGAARIGIGAGGQTQVLFDAVLAGPASFGTGGTVFGTGAGDALFLAGDLGDLYLPQGYVSGASLSATLSFAGATYASLGVTAGSHLYTLRSGDTLTVTFADATPVPAPATLALAGLALLIAAAARRRRN
jgi:hypothetical protein